MERESSETWDTECTQRSGFRDFHLVWRAFSIWMLSSLFCTLLPTLQVGTLVPGGSPAAGAICALKKTVLCPSTRNPIASRLGVPRGAGLQMLGSRWLEAVPGRILQAALETGALKRSLQGVQKHGWQLTPMEQHWEQGKQQGKRFAAGLWL